MSKKQWYKNQWDKEVFKKGIQAWNKGHSVNENPFNSETEPIDYALWMMGWSYAMVND